MGTRSINDFAILSTSALSTLLRQDPTPEPTEAVVYSMVRAEGQATIAMTVFQLTTGDILISMLLVVLAVLLLGILITLIWRRNA